MEHGLHKLGQTVRGWTAYLRLSQYYRPPVPDLDDWIRRRIRMCCRKQWRRVRTKIKHLLALGRGSKSACADLDGQRGRSTATPRPARLSLKTAIDPHGGWCGGWKLETPGYPIGHHAVRGSALFGDLNATPIRRQALRPSLGSRRSIGLGQDAACELPRVACCRL